MSEQRAKYGNKKAEYDGLKFDSLMEMRRYQELRLLEYAGEIRDLEWQPAFDIVVNGQHICNYRADFAYYDCKTEKTVIEDVKGVRTPVFRLKKKLLFATHGFEVIEVTA